MVPTIERKYRENWSQWLREGEENRSQGPSTPITLTNLLISRSGNEVSNLKT